ncbi:hypothetical protein JHK87_039665 [Glycine soja]|nr:hypothetical protein JHK87_039665 [Glycine soja]
MKVEGSSEKMIVTQQEEMVEARVSLAYRDQLRANFEFISKLGVNFWCFHDRDITPDGKTLEGKTLRCSLSETKHRLFIGNVPKTWTEDDFRKVVEGVGPRVETTELIKVVVALEIGGALGCCWPVPEIPENLYHLIKKVVSIRNHLERNKKDKDSKFRLILVDSRIHRLAR